LREKLAHKAEDKATKCKSKHLSPRMLSFEVLTSKAFRKSNVGTAFACSTVYTVNCGIKNKKLTDGYHILAG